MRIRSQDGVEQLVVQFLVEHQACVELRIQHAHHLVLAAGQFQRLLEIHLALLGFAAERGRADGIDHAQIQVGAAVVVMRIERRATFQRGLQLGQVGDRIPIASVDLDLAGPGGGESVHDRHVAMLGLAQLGDVGVVGFVQRLAQVLFTQAQCAMRVVVSAIGKPLRTLGIVDESAGVSAIEFRAGEQCAGVVRIALNHAVDQQQIRRHAVAHGTGVVLVEDGRGQVVGELVGRLAHHAAAGAEQHGADEHDKTQALHGQGIRNHGARRIAQVAMNSQ